MLSTVLTDSEALGTEADVVDGNAAHRGVARGRLELQEVPVVDVGQYDDLAVPGVAVVLVGPPDAPAVILVGLHLDQVQAQGDRVRPVLDVEEPHLRRIQGWMIFMAVCVGDECTNDDGLKIVSDFGMSL